MLKQESLEGGGTRYSTEHGSVDVLTPAPGILVHRSRGHGTLVVFEPVKQSIIEAHERTPHLALYSDIAGVQTYDSELRAAWVSWFRSNIDLFDEIHVCPRGAIATVGAQILEFAIGDVLKIHSSQESLEAALQEAIRRATSAAQPGT